MTRAHHKSEGLVIVPFPGIIYLILAYVKKVNHLPHDNALLTPLKYSVFENIMENRANAPFSLIFPKVFKF